MADLPGKPLEDHGVYRLLHGADHSLSGVVRVPGVGSTPQADRAFQCPRASDGRVDRTATARGLPVWGGAAISSTRSGWYLRSRFHQGGRASGHRRSALGAAFPLATGLHRARDWVDSARVPRPRDRFQRGIAAPTHEGVRAVLSRDSDAPVAGKGHAGESVGATAGPWASGCAAASWRSSSSVRTSGSVKTGGAGSCRVQLHGSAISPFGWRATAASLQSLFPPKLTA